MVIQNNSIGIKAPLPLLLLPLAMLAGLLTDRPAFMGTAQAQEPARWYQIEISIFTNEDSNLATERWPTERMASVFPGNTRPLLTLMDYLDLQDWDSLNPLLARPVAGAGLQSEIPSENQSPARYEGPEPPQNSDFRLPDFQRDAFLVLPSDTHNFTETNRALNTSPSYRLLYHSAWRQPVNLPAQASPVGILAGRQYGERHELEGTLTIRFNPGQDRVVLDAGLWLTQFSTLPPDNQNALRLPALPENLRSATSTTLMSEPPQYFPRQIIPVNISRDMRSNEFHYVDHPALGIVVQVFPYTPPDAVTLLPEQDQLPL
jgi:hypothetical protein